MCNPILNTVKKNLTKRNIVTYKNVNMKIHKYFFILFFVIFQFYKSIKFIAFYLNAQTTNIKCQTEFLYLHSYSTNRCVYNMKNYALSFKFFWNLIAAKKFHTYSFRMSNRISNSCFVIVTNMACMQICVQFFRLFFIWKNFEKKLEISQSRPCFASYCHVM